MRSGTGAGGGSVTVTLDESRSSSASTGIATAGALAASGLAACTGAGDGIETRSASTEAVLAADGGESIAVAAGRLAATAGEAGKAAFGAVMADWTGGFPALVATDFADRAGGSSIVTLPRPARKLMCVVRRLGSDQRPRPGLRRQQRCGLLKPFRLGPNIRRPLGLAAAFEHRGEPHQQPVIARRERQARLRSWIGQGRSGPSRRSNRRSR